MNTIEHPGLIIRRFLDSERRTQTSIAAELGISKAYLCDLTHGRRGISASIAKKLAQVLGMTPHYWMYQQVDYDLQERPK